MSLYEDLKKYVPRTEQLETIQFIKDNIDKKYYLLNLPTGVGKSYLALMIADFYSKNIDVTAKVDIITNSKLLQEQYTNTFNSIRDLRGKENYTCSKYSCSCLTGKEFARLNKTIPSFAPGDTVVVQVKVKEGNRERLQAYEGVVIAKRNRGLNSAFIVRKISAGEGVERTFQTYSPLVESIEVKRRGDVRRAKLYYLRDRSGKSARIKEKLVRKVVAAS